MVAVRLVDALATHAAGGGGPRTALRADRGLVRRGGDARRPHARRDHGAARRSRRRNGSRDADRGRDRRAIGALAAAAIDGRVLGFGPPWLCRQVNEAWLSQFRPWVYAGGFGWQIGAGVTTYVMTAAVPLLIAIGALSGSPGAALALGTGFGVLRGCAVLLGRSIRSPEALYAAHRRFDAWTVPVRDAVIVVELVVAVVAAAWMMAPVALAGVVSATAVAIAIQLTPSRRIATSTRMTSTVEQNSPK